ncbi:cytochrome P450 86B1-like [Wolffia australiana]
MVAELLLAAAIFFALRAVRQRRAQGLAAWPVVGMLPSLLLGLRRDMYEWVTRVLSRQNGTFVFRGPWFSNLHCVVTADPRNVEFMLKTKFSSFPKGDYFRETVKDLLGDGIFAADGAAWRRQRRAASFHFHSAEFRAVAVRSLEELVRARLVPVLEAARRGGSAVDLQDVLLRLTFDNVSLLAFGVDPGCLRPGLPDIPFAAAFEAATAATVARFVAPTAVWRTLRRLRLGPERSLRRAIAAVDEFAYAVIAARKEEGGARGKDDLLSVFMRLTDDEGRPFSDKFLRDICVNFILAGRDTSSVALAWFFWLLARNPAVEEKILAELRRVKKTDDSSLVFLPEEVKKMDYLQAAISESLRLYPSVPVDHKQLAEDEVFPDGRKLKKGTKVVYAIYSMGRMEGIWGRDCKEFKPERWIRDGRFVNESAYKFAAFNGGPRLCLGKDFAYYQMKFVAASILLRYRVHVAHDHPVVPKLALTMYMKHGLKVTLSSREQDTDNP